MKSNVLKKLGVKIENNVVIGKTLTIDELKSGVVNKFKGGLMFIYTIIGFALGIITLFSFTLHELYQVSLEDALKINIWKAKFYGDVLVFFGHDQDEVEELVKKKIELIEMAAKFYGIGWKVLTYEEIKRESF